MTEEEDELVWEDDTGGDGQDTTTAEDAKTMDSILLHAIPRSVVVVELPAADAAAAGGVFPPALRDHLRAIKEALWAKIQSRFTSNHSAFRDWRTEVIGVLVKRHLAQAVQLVNTLLHDNALLKALFPRGLNLDHFATSRLHEMRWMNRVTEQAAPITWAYRNQLGVLVKPKVMTPKSVQKVTGLESARFEEFVRQCTLAVERRVADSILADVTTLASEQRMSWKRIYKERCSAENIWPVTLERVVNALSDFIVSDMGKVIWSDCLPPRSDLYALLRTAVRDDSIPVRHQTVSERCDEATLYGYAQWFLAKFGRADDQARLLCHHAQQCVHMCKHACDPPKIVNAMLVMDAKYRAGQHPSRPYVEFKFELDVWFDRYVIMRYLKLDADKLRRAFVLELLDIKQRLKTTTAETVSVTWLKLCYESKKSRSPTLRDLCEYAPPTWWEMGSKTPTKAPEMALRICSLLCVYFLRLPHKHHDDLVSSKRRKLL